MSEPKRYTDLQVWEALHFAGSTNGWIRWDDYARLKAEVERLRKAGDAMAKELPMIADTHLSDEVWVRMQIDWERAKEGKPSV